MDKVNALKDEGNKAMAEGRFEAAASAYTAALQLDPSNHVLHSNRSAVYAKMEKFEDSLKDAEKCIELNPNFIKGYSRKGLALTELGRLAEAYQAYNIGMQKDPANDSLMQGARSVLLLLQEELSAQNPNLFGQMGSSAMDVDNDSPPAQPSPKKPEPQKPKQPEMSEEDKNLSEGQRAAKREKELGNAAYKKKDFENALKHYTAAIGHDPNDITFHNNIAAVYFEQKDYQKCIQECEKAVEIGRDNRADYKLIAKAFTRIGNAYRKIEDFKSAKTFFEKSLSEYRTPEVKALLSDTEKIIKELERTSYIDPQKAEEEKELGNECFKQGDYSTAVKHYTEAVHRNPDDPKLYSNRAACYTKLAAFDLGLKDCEKCCELDGTFIKGWIRKGKILQVMKKHSQALTAYQKALEIDPTNAEALEGYRTCTVAVQKDPQEVWKKAMHDPEVQQILKDPAMRVILEQMQNDPKAVQEHLKNPQVASKIQKLLESGIIQIY